MKNRCPNCGYCPHCGRSNPVYPRPWFPNHPYGPYWYGKGGSTIKSGGWSDSGATYTNVASHTLSS